MQAANNSAVAEASVGGLQVGGGQDAGGELYFLEFEKTKIKDSMSRRLAPTSGDGVLPYMDVMTISSSVQPVSKNGIENALGAHTKLLVEPVSVPKLEHTGLRTKLVEELQDNVGSYFYPNGTKKLAFRDTIRQKLKEASQLAENFGMSSTLSTSSLIHSKPWDNNSTPIQSSRGSKGSSVLGKAGGSMVVGSALGEGSSSKPKRRKKRRGRKHEIKPNATVARLERRRKKIPVTSRYMADGTRSQHLQSSDLKARQLLKSLHLDSERLERATRYN